MVKADTILTVGALAKPLYDRRSPLGPRNLTFWVAHSIVALFLLSQSMPRMTSSWPRSKRIRLEGISTPKIWILTLGYMVVHDTIPPLGVETDTDIACGAGSSKVLAKVEEINEYDAPESNKTNAGLDRIWNVPVTTLAWSASVWFITLIVPAAGIAATGRT